MDQPNATEWSLTIVTTHRYNFVSADSYVWANYSWEEAALPSPIISDAVMQRINIYVNIMICGGVSAFGMVNNIINMVIFYKLGLKDSMSIGLTALSFTDFLHCLVVVVSRGFSIWETVYRPVSFDPLGINYVCFDWVRDILYLSSGWITTFLSIERCVCVVFPFKVKQIFTRGRCVVTVLVIYAVHVAIYMPAFVTQWLGWVTVVLDGNNGTVVIVERLEAVFSDDRPKVDAYVDIADGIPFLSQLIVVISVVWMIHGLRMSAKLRKAMTRLDRDLGVDAGTSKSSGMSNRNNRLMKVVLFLAIILIVCNMPRFIAAYARHVHSEVTLGDQDQNLFVFLWTLAILFTVINASVNIFVYLIINSSYRSAFRKMFGCMK